MVARWIAAAMVTLAAARVGAQETRLQADLSREGTDIRESCAAGFDPKSLAGCIYTLGTDDPFHVAFGSLAPQNGTGFGAAFVEHWTPNERWRIGWNADAVVASSGSYRAGVYMKIVPTPTPAGGGIVVRRPGDASASPGRPNLAVHEYPVWNVYAQTTSLDTVPLVAGGPEFRERHTVVGTNLVLPVTRISVPQPLRLSLLAGVNGRFVDTSSASAQLNQNARFAQFEEGLRVRPSVAGDYLQLNYLATLQQFLTSSASAASFHRWTVDLQHTIPFYRTVSSTEPDTNGPDDCGVAVGTRCAPLSFSRNREGSVGFRILASRSIGNAGSTVPFYFQPTLGGSDLNGQRLLSAYEDYAFRGTNLFALQESLEHSIWGPVGAYLLFEQGTLTPEGSGLTTSGMHQSAAVGLTVRAGGFPLINLTFAWGGGGHHVIGTIDPTLLGGSSRPSLY